MGIVSECAMTTAARLDEWGTQVWQSLPADADAEFPFERGTLPEPPELIQTPALVIKRGDHYYGNYRIDYPQWYGAPEIYGRLGLLILACAFHQRAEQVVLELTHSESEIKWMLIQAEHPAHVPGLPELSVAPVRFS